MLFRSLEVIARIHRKARKCKDSVAALFLKDLAIYMEVKQMLSDKKLYEDLQQLSLAYNLSHQTCSFNSNS